MFTRNVVVFITVAVALPNFVWNHPAVSTTLPPLPPRPTLPEAFVAVSGTPTLQNEEAAKKELQPPQLKSMHVTSNVRNRYSHTVVSSRYVNPDSSAQETTFSINLPETAFITGFIMEVDGKKYEAYIREKEEAKRVYDQAVQSGLGAAHVAVNARDSNKFTVSVNVEPQNKVTFNLTYEQLLVRKHGKYEMIINLNPGQLVKDLVVDVHINETRPILSVDAPAIRSGNEISDTDKSKNEYATVTKTDAHVAHVTFAPTVEQQKEVQEKLKTEHGLSGQFIVEYDVETDPNGGEVIVNDGYFVHFFAPSDLKPIPKHVVFVLDVSGSMSGRKIEQLREAMKIILSQLNPEDYFNIIKFHSNVQVWGKDGNWLQVEIPQESELPPAFPASAEYIANAQKTVENMTDEGLTDIYDALLIALRLTNKGIENAPDKHTRQPIIIFLTDGQANVGISGSEPIIEMVESRNNKKAAVFSLSFGVGANEELLKNVALKNSGFMRHIYEASDASLQLQEFYKQISSPLLTNVNFKYTDEKAKAVTKHNYDILFKGSELVVAGRIDDPQPDQMVIECGTFDGPRIYHPRIIPLIRKPEVKEEYGNLERLWAYLTIKQLLDKKYEKNETNSTDAETPEKQALKLALKYSFVTPVTSLVVVKPNKTEATSAIKTDEQLDYGSDSFHNSGAVLKSAFIPFMRAHSGGASRGINRARTSLSRPYAISGGIPLSAVSFASASGFPGVPGVPLIVGGSASFLPPTYLTTPSTLVLGSVQPSLPPLPPPSHLPVNEPAATLIEKIDELPWLTPLFTAPGDIKIDDKHYLVGSNDTSIELKDCQVQESNLKGHCALLTACPSIYATLDTLDTYKKYFCTLNADKYAGVCCVKQNN